MKRIDGRTNDQMRPVTLETGVLKYAEGSCLIKFGDTHVLCAASVEERVPPFLKNSGKGWVTAEYSMLPRSCRDRNQRETKGLGGRTMEIQRLIGRSLRAVVQTEKLGERTITLDCDVLQGDGGTRTASITGAYVALVQALGVMKERRLFTRLPLEGMVAAISVGVVQGETMIDLCYEEDSTAQVDMNLIMTEQGRFIEVQGTAEGAPYDRAALNGLIDMGWKGIRELNEMQKAALGGLI